MLSNGISRSSLIAYAAPTFCLMFLVGPAQSLIQGVYTQHFGLRLADLASIIFIARIFDAITDPAIGFLSDRKRDKWPGGRKVFVVVGSGIALVAVYFLFIPQWDVSAGYFFLWYMLCYLAWTIIEIPHLSWGSELSRDYKDRSTVFSYRAAFYYFGYAAFLALPLLPIFDEDGYTPKTLVVAFWVVAVLFPITVYFAVKKCPQGTATETHKETSIWHVLGAFKWNKPLRSYTVVFVMIGLGLGMQTGIAFLYITSFLGLHKEAPIIFIVGFPLAIVALPVWLGIAKTIGKHYAMATGAFLTAITFVFLAVLEPGSQIYVKFFALFIAIHLLQSSWIAIGPAMLGDIIDYDQSQTGEDNSATYFAFSTFIKKVFEGIGGGAGLLIAAIYGFEPSNLVINDEVIFSMHLVMGYLPATAFAVAAIYCMRSPITMQEHEQILRRIAKGSATAKLN